MSRLRSHKSPPQTDGSWVFEGHQNESGSESAEDEQPRRSPRTSAFSSSKAAQSSPIFTSETFTAPQVNSPTFTPSINGRSTTSSVHSGTPQRKSQRMNQSAPHLSPQEPRFVMPSMREPGFESSSSSSRSATGSGMFSNSNKRSSEQPPAEDFAPRQRRTSKRAKTEPVETAAAAASFLGMIWTELVSPALRVSAYAFGIVLSFFKPLLAILFGLWIFLAVGQHLFTRVVTRAIAPICDIPGVSYLNIPFCVASSKSAGPVEFDELMTVQSAFEDVLASSAGGATLPLDMKRSEASVRDLKHVVEYSTLPSKGELVFEFTGFIDTARQAAADLTRFNSRIGRAIDHVLSTNRWTLQVIDGVAAREEAQGSVGRFIQSTVMAPFRTARVTEDLLLEQYLQHTRTIEEQIASLILEAQALLMILQNLDDRLDVIHSITTRDGVTVKGDRDELLAQLWTLLGGNRAEVKKQKEQMALLRQLFVYRKTAWEHVSGTILKLQAIAAGLEDLRERVAAPEVVGVRKDVPLRLHIERIQMGVDRLEQQRGEQRRMEGQAQRAILDRGDGAGAQGYRMLDRG